MWTVSFDDLQKLIRYLLVGAKLCLLPPTFISYISKNVTVFAKRNFKMITKVK